MASSHDPLLGRLALITGKINAAQLKQCLEEQATLEQKGVSQDLGQILCTSGLLTAEELAELQKQLDKKEFICRDCHEVYLRDDIPLSQATCEECGGPLELSSLSTTPEALACFEKTLRRFIAKGLISTEELAYIRKLQIEGKINLELLEELYGGKQEQSVIYRQEKLPEIKPVTFGHYYKGFFPLGHGSMGETYKGWQVDTFDTLVLKHIASLQPANNEIRKQFLQGIAVYRQFSHPYLLPVLDCGQEGNEVFLITPWIEGHSLAQALHDYPMPRNIEEIRALLVCLVKVAEGVEYLHQHDFRHCNIKPSNILIHDGYPYLCDPRPYLPNAAQLWPDRDVTALYRAPETRQGIVENRSDIYSMGVILYELATGQAPFQGSLDEMLARQQNEDPLPLKNINRHLPEQLELIIFKALDRSWRDRYARAQDLARDLDRFLAGEPVKVSAPGLLRKLLRWGRLYPVRASLILLGLLSALALFLAPRAGLVCDYIHAQDLLRRAREQARQGVEYDKIASLFRQALAQMPPEHRHLVHLAHGKLLLEKALAQQDERAKELMQASYEQFQQALKLAPQHGETLFQMWHWYQVQNKSAILQAQELIQQLTRLPANEYSFFSRAYLKVQQACHEPQAGRKLRLQNEAIALYSAAIKYNPKFHWAYYERGNLYFLQERRSQALEDYDQAIELAPREALAYVRRGTLYYEQKCFNEAMADYNRAIELNANYGEAYCRRGDLFRAQKRYQEALANYNKAIAVNPRQPSFFCHRGALYQEWKLYHKALRDYTTAQQLAPNNAMIYTQRGVVLCQLGQYRQALADLNKSLALAPAQAQTYIARGTVFSGRQEYQKALDDFNQATRLNPCLTSVYTKRGLLLQAMRCDRKALEDFEKAIELAPKKPLHYFHRGNFYQARGQIKMALQDYAQALHLNPKLACIYTQRGHLYYTQKKYAAALHDLEQAIALPSKSAASYFTRALVYWDLHQPTKALDDLSEAVNMDPFYIAAYLQRARYHQELNQNDEALADYTNAIRLGSDQARLQRARLYEKLGQWENALRDYRQLISRQPQHWQAHAFKGQLHYRRKEYEQAIAEFKTALKLKPGDIQIEKQLKMAERLKLRRP